MKRSQTDGLERRPNWKPILLKSKNKHPLLLQLTRETSALTTPWQIQPACLPRLRTVGSRRRHGGRCLDAASLLANWLSRLRRMTDQRVCRRQTRLGKGSCLNISRQEKLSVSLWLVLADGPPKHTVWRQESLRNTGSAGGYIFN